MQSTHATDEVIEYGKTYTRGEFLPFYVPRAEMPQVDDNYLTNLIEAAENSNHLGCEMDAVPPHSLKFHQRIDVNKAETMDLRVKMKPIIVSNDGFVLDGNHRLWRHLHDNDPYILVIRLNMPFNKAIPWLLALPFVWEIKNHPQEEN